jgi:hypothetical protein
LAALHVPLAARRDLKPPYILHLDTDERFPRVTVRAAGAGPLFGPFRGLGCLSAQVRSCAAPCLKRVSEQEYRALATRVAAWLSDPSRRGDAPSAVPAIVAATASGRAVIVDAGKRSVELFPLRSGRVLDAAALVVAPGDLDAAVSRLEWPEPAGAEDWPWLTAWLSSPKRRASFVVVPVGASAAELGARLRAALPVTFAGLAAGGNVGATREEA